MRALNGPDDRGPGGQGGGAPPEALPAFPAEDFTRTDARMMAQAIKGRWPMSEETRARVIRTLEFVATGDPWGQLFDGRTMVAAARAIIDADKVNVVTEATQAAAPELVELGPGTFRPDFSKMTDDELDRFLKQGGR